MKKPLLIFLCLITFLFSACSVKPAEPELNFSCRIKATYNGEKLSGSIVSDKRHMLTLTVNPNDTGEVVYSYKDGKFRMKCRNMNVDAEDNYLPNSAFAQAVYNVLSRLYNKKYTLRSTYNSIAEYKGESESGAFTIKTELKTGKILTLKADSVSLSAKFS